MTTRLMLYNEALRLCGERKLASLTEAREPRYLLDDVWNNGGVQACLEKGQWNFAARFVKVTYDTEVTPAFGHNRAFSKPTDWVRTMGITSDEFFSMPLIHYTEEGSYWYASIDDIYVKYVSNGNSYGNDLSIWPQAFADFAAAHFAGKIIKKLTGDEKKEDGIINPRNGTETLRLKEAKSLDASGDPQKFPSPGNWVTSRYTGRRRDRGNRGSLIG